MKRIVYALAASYLMASAANANMMSNVQKTQTTPSKITLNITIQNTGISDENFDLIRVSLPIQNASEVKMTITQPTSLKGDVYTDTRRGVYCEFWAEKSVLPAGQFYNGVAGILVTLEKKSGQAWTPIVTAANVSTVNLQKATPAARSSTASPEQYLVDKDPAFGWDWHSATEKHSWVYYSNAYGLTNNPWSTNTFGDVEQATDNSYLPEDGWELFARRIEPEDFYPCQDVSCIGYLEFEKYFILYNRKQGRLSVFNWIARKGSENILDVALVTKGASDGLLSGTNYFNLSNGLPMNSSTKPSNRFHPFTSQIFPGQTKPVLIEGKWYVTDFTLDYDELSSATGLERMSVLKLPMIDESVNFDGNLRNVYDTLNKYQTSPSQKSWYADIQSELVSGVKSAFSGVASSVASNAGKAATGWLSKTLEQKGCGLVNPSQGIASYPFACYDQNTGNLLPPAEAINATPTPDQAKINAYMSASKIIKDKGPQFLNNIISANVPGAVSDIVGAGFSLLFGNKGVSESQMIIQQSGSTIDISGHIANSRPIRENEFYSVSMASGSPTYLDKVSYFAKQHKGKARLGVVNISQAPRVFVATKDDMNHPELYRRKLIGFDGLQKNGWLKINPHAGMDDIQSINYRLEWGASQYSRWFTEADANGVDLAGMPAYGALKLRVQVNLRSTDNVPSLFSKEYVLDVFPYETVSNINISNQLGCGGGLLPPCPPLHYWHTASVSYSSLLPSVNDAKNFAVKNGVYEIPLVYPGLATYASIDGVLVPILEYKDRSITVRVNSGLGIRRVIVKTDWVTDGNDVLFDKTLKVIPYIPLDLLLD